MIRYYETVYDADSLSSVSLGLSEIVAPTHGVIKSFEVHAPKVDSNTDWKFQLLRNHQSLLPASNLISLNKNKKRDYYRQSEFSFKWGDVISVDCTAAGDTALKTPILFVFEFDFEDDFHGDVIGAAQSNQIQSIQNRRIQMLPTVTEFRETYIGAIFDRDNRWDVGGVGTSWEQARSSLRFKPTVNINADTNAWWYTKAAFNIDNQSLDLFLSDTLLIRSTEAAATARFIDVCFGWLGEIVQPFTNNIFASTPNEFIGTVVRIHPTTKPSVASHFNVDARNTKVTNKPTITFGAVPSWAQYVDAIRIKHDSDNRSILYQCRFQRYGQTNYDWTDVANIKYLTTGATTDNLVNKRIFLSFNTNKHNTENRIAASQILQASTKPIDNLPDKAVLQWDATNHVWQPQSLSRTFETSVDIDFLSAPTKRDYSYYLNSRDVRIDKITVLLIKKPLPANAGAMSVEFYKFDAGNSYPLTESIRNQLDTTKTINEITRINTNNNKFKAGDYVRVFFTANPTNFVSGKIFFSGEFV